MVQGGDDGDEQACQSMIFTTDLSAVRAFVHRTAREAGLTEARAIDLVLAVSEVAANTVLHAGSPGRLDIWRDKEEIVCQIKDKGVISGEPQPGHGLWLVDQVCDEV